jgi:hypothetical protein
LTERLEWSRGWDRYHIRMSTGAVGGRIAALFVTKLPVMIALMKSLAAHLRAPRPRSSAQSLPGTALA